MTPNNNNDPLKNFLNRNQFDPPPAPVNEFALIRSRILAEKSKFSWPWISALILTASMAAFALMLQLQEPSSRINEDELAEFFHESYSLEEDNEVVGEHYLGLVNNR